jgi:hypothetical protein
MTLARHLVVFARTPRLGRVKTRLGRDIGAVAAWAFYRRTLRSVLRRISGDRRWRCWIAITPDAGIHLHNTWGPGCWRVNQGGGSLGERMGRVARALPPGPVVIVGADIPGIRQRHIAQAFKALGRFDAVFGPAADGGYWLVGLRRRPRFQDIFSGVRWSTEHALEDTLGNLGPGQTHALLETLEDIDDGEAYAKWKKARP